MYHIWTVISASPLMLEILSQENLINIKHHKIGNATENIVVWWQNGDLGLGWVEYIQRFIVDSGRWDPTDHKSDWWHPVIIEQFSLLANIFNISANIWHKDLISEANPTLS